MKETTKAMTRRFTEGQFQSNDATYKWLDIFKGKGIDVGAGDDPIITESCQPFDWEQGDANFLDSYFDNSVFDYLHASQTLEHMVNPVDALKSWLKVIKSKGFAVITVPCWELYEGMIWPPRFNHDHKTTFSLWQPDSPAPNHVFLPSWFHKNDFDGDLLLCRLVDTNFDYKVGTSVDQTFVFEDLVECSIELVIQKK